MASLDISYDIPTLLLTSASQSFHRRINMIVNKQNTHRDFPG